MSRPHGTLERVLSGTGDAAFAVDHLYRILYANEELLRITGASPGSVRGRPCSEVVRGCRLDGEGLCGSNCPISQHFAAEGQVPSFDIAIPEAGGGLIWLNAGGVRAPAEWSPAAAVFFLRMVHLPQLIRGLASSEQRGTEAERKPYPELTSRERSVLRQLADGRSTEGIAAELWISSATVRNHVGRILRKLGVNSRTEAVAQAFRQGLVR